MLEISPSIRMVLVTGATGFIGKNLVIRLREQFNLEVIPFVRRDNPADLHNMVCEVDAVVHLAGENRPVDEESFERDNIELTSVLCESISKRSLNSGRYTPLIFASSIQAASETSYGQSKLKAESIIGALAEKTNNPCFIFRLPGVFGKWCRPNYNSVVATFCHNVANDLPLQVHDPSVVLRLVHVDNVVQAFLETLRAPGMGLNKVKVEPEYEITVSELAARVLKFKDCRRNLEIQNVGRGLDRALYSTFVSYLPKDKFAYPLRQYADSRGRFVEMLKSADGGQISYFTALPGVTRGRHYHHTKTEKFLVMKGEALFRFRNLLTDELVEMRVSGEVPEVVDTIPGWVHEVTNIGKDELLVMLWANENFDRSNPDTFSQEV